MKTCYLLLVLSGLLLVGCASKQILPEANNIPKGASRVVLIRKGSLVGAGERFKVFDPGKPYDGDILCSEPKNERSGEGWLVGKISSGGRLTWNRVPGPMWLTLRPSQGFLNVPGGPDRRAEEIVTEAGKEYTVEVSIGLYKGVGSIEETRVTVRDLH